MSQLATTEPHAVAEMHPAQPDAGAALVQMIERAASNPAVDIDKMERLLEMHERVTIRQAKTAYSSALAEMQPNLPVISERGRIVVPGKGDKDGHSTPYAKWEDINDAIRPVLHQHGFALSFRTGTAPDGRVTVTGVLSHRDGHSEETTMTLMHDSSGSKNAVQAIGSSTSYGKRYTAMALLNITTRGEDDDAETADPGQFVTQDQVDEIRDMIESVGADREKFLNYMKVGTISHIAAKDYPRAIAALQKKAAR